MHSYLAAFLVALVATSVFTPLAASWARRLGAVSVPGGRHVHARVIPRLGGLALAAGWLTPLAAGLALALPVQAMLQVHRDSLVAAALGGIAMCAVGAVDDIRGLRVLYKLGAQILCAIFAYSCGFRIEAVDLPFFGTLNMGVFALPVTTLWIVGVTNAVNLIDGLDGLAAGVAFTAAATSFVISYLSGSPFVALAMAALMGTLLGFLFFNFNPARIFMGDSGSYFLGYVIATLSLAGSVQQKTSTAVSLLVPVIALGVPIFDTLLTMVRRILERRPVFSPDRGHIHHRLLDLGLTHRRAVLLLYAVSAVFAVAAIGISVGRSIEVGLALFSVSAIAVGLVRFVGYFEYLPLLRRDRLRSFDERTERLRQELPRTLSELSAARTRRALHEALSSAFERLALDVLEVDGLEHGRYERTDHTPGRRESVEASFPLEGGAWRSSRVRFVWREDSERLGPQAEILLQVVVDGIAAALERCSATEIALVDEHAQPTLRAQPLVLPGSR